ncbi:MAG: Wzt carbohydrate-binding domain-containing protein, partial [Cellulomonas sp.]
EGRISALLELGSGFHPDLSGRENVYLNASILGLSKRDIDLVFDEIVDFSGIGGFIDAPVKVYSSGMYVRLGFSVAVHVDPEILIIDEVVAVGDEEFQRKCFDHLFKLRSQGTTIVLVTHSMGLAAELCDSAVWLDHGDVRAIGTAPEVIDQYLAEVNEREAEARQSEGGDDDVETAPDVTRTGSGEIRVTGVELLGADGKPAPILLTGEPLTVRVAFTARERVDDVAFFLGFVHENGVGITGTNTRMHHRGAVPVPAGSGFVDYTFDALPLLPANWRLSVALRSRGHTYDHLDKAYPLAVRASGETENGAVRISGRWSDPVVDGVPAYPAPAPSVVEQ